MFAICTSGSVTSPMKIRYISRSPMVIRPETTARPPKIISSTPIDPTTAVPIAPVADVPVMVCATLTNSRFTPAANTTRSRSSAV